MCRPSKPRLIAITDTTRIGPEELIDRVEVLCEKARPGSVLVQLRDRQLDTCARLELGRRLHQATTRFGQRLSVNDRVDLCLLLGSALHLGERSVTPEEARRLLGESCFISVACHDPKRVAVPGANAVVLSPIAEPRKSAPALGLDALGEARRHHAPLLYALGGISAHNARDCLDAGADGVAAIGAVFGSEPIEPLLAALGIGK